MLVSRTTRKPTRMLLPTDGYKRAIQAFLIKTDTCISLAVKRKLLLSMDKIISRSIWNHVSFPS